MKESTGKKIRGRIDAMLADHPREGAFQRQTAMLKAAWERLTPAEEWASDRKYGIDARRFMS